MRRKKSEIQTKTPHNIGVAGCQKAQLFYRLKLHASKDNNLRPYDRTKMVWTPQRCLKSNNKQKKPVAEMQKRLSKRTPDLPYVPQSFINTERRRKTVWFLATTKQKKNWQCKSNKTKGETPFERIISPFAKFPRVPPWYPLKCCFSRLWGPINTGRKFRFFEFFEKAKI